MVKGGRCVQPERSRNGIKMEHQQHELPNNLKVITSSFACCKLCEAGSGGSMPEPIEAGFIIENSQIRNERLAIPAVGSPKVNIAPFQAKSQSV